MFKFKKMFYRFDSRGNNLMLISLRLKKDDVKCRKKPKESVYKILLG